jgi:hypothetical protein
LNLRFLNFCPPPGNNTYVVKTTFSACENPANQLISYDTIQVNRVNALNATTSTTNTGCGAPTGTITITVAGGVSPYTYVLDGGAPVIAPSPYTFTNVGPGLHTIQVTDATGLCSTTTTATVNSAGNLSATTTSSPTACPGVNNGSITITSASGTGPYTFSLDGAPAVAGTIPFTFNNLSQGSHTIIVTDLSTNCATTPIIETVGVGPGITATTSTTATACSGVNNGSIIITSASGTGPYTFSLDGGIPVAGTIPFTFNNVSPNNHTIVINDLGTGCSSAPINVFVATGPGVNGSATTIATSCPTASNGSITVTATAGTAPFTFQLNAGPPQTGSNPYTFNNVVAGIHTVIITDNFGCTVTLNNISVASGPPLTANTSSTATSCNGAGDGTITVTPTSGTAPYTFSLDGGPPQSGPARPTYHCSYRCCRLCK